MMRSILASVLGDIVHARSIEMVAFPLGQTLWLVKIGCPDHTGLRLYERALSFFNNDTVVILWQMVLYVLSNLGDCLNLSVSFWLCHRHLQKINSISC